MDKLSTGGQRRRSKIYIAAGAHKMIRVLVDAAAALSLLRLPKVVSGCSHQRHRHTLSAPDFSRDPLPLALDGCYTPSTSALFLLILLKINFGFGKVIHWAFFVSKHRVITIMADFHDGFLKFHLYLYRGQNISKSRKESFKLFNRLRERE